MDIIISLVSDCVVKVGGLICKCIYPKIENIIHFSSEIENLRKEMEKLTKLRDDKKGNEGNNVVKWIEDVCELENEWTSMQESIAAAKTLTYKCCPNCSLRSEVYTQAQKMVDQICRLKEVGERFGSILAVKKVEFIPVRSIQGQSTSRNLNKIMQLLEDDKACIIGVCGMGGIGKTTLVKNLNNGLLQDCSKLSFNVVVWVTVPKPPIDIRKVQAQIADRLSEKLDNEGSEESNASKIYQRLKKEKSFVLILDDVWEAIDLDHVGVPQLKGSKVIITSRSLDVCRQMKTDTDMNVSTLDEDESWQLFVKNAGNVANLEHIQPLAKDIARECGGLPLAISVIGASMRGKEKASPWKDALRSLKMVQPLSKDVINGVYEVIKLTYNSLESPDIQSCFLYCSLYPEAIPTDDLIHNWWAVGFLGKHDTYEQAYDRGTTMVEILKAASLLEDYHVVDSLKMHDVVRDVAIWIDNSPGNEQNSLIQAGIGLTEIPHTEVSSSVKRISFISNKFERLPDHFMECPGTTTLLLQGNKFLEEIPNEFFLAFPALRVLNLSSTSISALPCSINSLCQLRALILQNCRWLTELPPIGNLCNLQVLDCDNSSLRDLPQGLDKLTNLRLLNVLGRCLGETSFDEISSLPNLTSLFIRLDKTTILNIDPTWIKRLKSFHIEFGNNKFLEKFNKSARTIGVSLSETFKKGELSGMLHFASHLYLNYCRALRKFIVNKKSFNGLKRLHIYKCACDFGPVEEGSGQIDYLPNLEHLTLNYINNLKSVSDFGHFLGLRFSKLRLLDIDSCDSLTCLFNVGGAFSAPKHLEEITFFHCKQLVEVFVQCRSSQTTLVKSETPRVRKLVLRHLPKLGTLGDPWEHLEELKVIGCYEIRKLPLSIQTSNNIKLITGESTWWSRLEWDDDNYKSNLQHCFKEDLW